MFSSLTASNGNYKESIIDFRPYGVKDIFAEVDACRFPSLPLDAGNLDWTSKQNFLRPFTELHGQYDFFSDIGSIIDPER